MQFGDQIIEDRVHDGFVENSLVAVGEEIEFQTFHFDAKFGGDVNNRDGREIGLAGDGADAGEFGEGEFDFVGAGRAGVFEGVEDGAGGWRSVDR